MNRRQIIARLRITPSWGMGPEHSTLKLVQIKESFRLEVHDWSKFGSNKRQQIPLDSAEVEQQLALLKRATIPAFPFSPMVCDGAYIELTIYGELSTVTLGWWTIVPEGAEAVKAFTNWLAEKVPPTEENES